MDDTSNEFQRMFDKTENIEQARTAIELLEMINTPESREFIPKFEVLKEQLTPKRRPYKPTHYAPRKNKPQA